MTTDNPEDLKKKKATIIDSLRDAMCGIVLVDTYVGLPIFSLVCFECYQEYNWCKCKNKRKLQ